MSGIILFSDPDTYAPTGVFYPDSWYLPPDGVQRGTLLRMRGDPLTRGYPSIGKDNLCMFLIKNLKRHLRYSL